MKRERVFAVLLAIVASAGLSWRLTHHAAPSSSGRVSGDIGIGPVLPGNGGATSGAGGGLSAVTADSPLAGSGTSGSHLTFAPTVVAPIAGTGSSGSGFTWAAGTNVSIASSDLRIANNASPTTPSANTLAIAAQSFASKELATVVGPTSAKMPLQPHLGHRGVSLFNPQAASTNIGLLGTGNTTTGTATARTIASTNLASSMKRMGGVSAAGANSVGGFRGAAAPFWRGNAAGLGGFYCNFRWMISDAAFVSTGQTFVGLWATTTAPTDVGPETLTNIFGIGNTNGDTVLQLYAGGAAAQARTSLGANFPANTTNVDVYEVILYAAPNDSQISYMVNRLNTGNTTSGSVSTGANLFSTTTFVGWQVWRSNGGTATAVGIDLISMWCETDV